MSFSLNVKNELIEKPREGCCALAMLSAIIHTGGSLNINKDGMYAEISTENEKLAYLVSSLLENLFSAEANLQTTAKSTLKKHILYTVRTPVELSEQILTELAVIVLDENNHRQISGGIDEYLTEQDCCKTSYLVGAFLISGSIAVPKASDSSNTGYNLRFLLSGREMAEGIRRLLSHFSINAKISELKNGFMVYVKEGESVCDFLALTGASRSFLRLQSLIIEREVKNNTNRQTNCILANIDKTVNAAVRQAEAINSIERSIGLDALPENLRKIARLRQEYPDVSLESIASLSGENLTKSGINHRMRKIMEIADKLSKDNT